MLKTIKVVSSPLTDGSRVYDVLVIGDGAVVRIPAADETAANNLANDIFASVLANGAGTVTLEI